MERYRIKTDQAKRKISITRYVPHEIDLFYSIVLGIWASVVIKECSCNLTSSCLSNLFQFSLILFALFFHHYFQSHLFSRAFKKGSLRTYSYIIWLAFAIVAVIFHTILNPVWLNDAQIFLMIIEAFLLVTLLYFIAVAIVHVGVKTLKAILMEKNELQGAARKGTLVILALIAIFILLFRTFTPALMTIVETMKTLIIQHGNQTDFYVISMIIIFSMVRILMNEGYYMISAYF